MRVLRAVRDGTDPAVRGDAGPCPVGPVRLGTSKDPADCDGAAGAPAGAAGRGTRTGLTATGAALMVICEAATGACWASA